jgi:hypothetical protein
LKSKKGFVRLEICFVATVKRNRLPKTSMISIIIVVHWASFGGSLAWHDVRRFRCPTRASPGPPLAASTEPKPCSADSFKSLQLLSEVARWRGLPTKDSVVASGSTDRGNQGPPRKKGLKPGQPGAESLAGPDAFPGLRTDGVDSLRTVRVCGAMSQQHGDAGRGNVSSPQKFVHLVGCRDPNARTGPPLRPRPSPSKQQS